MTHMQPDDVRCRECGHIGPAGVLETWGRGDPYCSINGVPTFAVDCCERCLSEDITTSSLCVHCGLRDATDDDYCHTCAVAVETTDVLCASRAGIERISDLHATIRECARGLR